MREVVFSIPVTGTIRIEDDCVTIAVNETTTSIILEPKEKTVKRLNLGKGRTLFDVLLETARAFVREKGTNEFTGADLYHMALELHPELSLKRNTWGARMISSAPNHPSYRYSTARRSYFRYLGDGRYSLDESSV